MSTETESQPERNYRQSPLRFIVLGVLVAVMGVLGVMLYLKHERDKEEAAAGEQRREEEDTTPGIKHPGVPDPKGALGDPKELDGNYTVAQMVKGTRPEPVFGTAVTIKDAQFHLPGDPIPFTIKALDRARPPFEVDLIQKVDGGQRFTQGVYKQDGDTLTFCLATTRREKVNIPGVGPKDSDVPNPRPTGFEPTDKNLLIVLKRK